MKGGDYHAEAEPALRALRRLAPRHSRLWDQPQLSPAHSRAIASHEYEGVSFMLMLVVRFARYAAANLAVVGFGVFN
jgi:hypothetical protein